MARMLYLHEVIDIVGDKAVEYMEQSVLGFHTDGAADRGLELWGTWYVMGSTGRWPQVVSIWEMADGWASWERLCRSTNVNREANAELNDWWLQALQRRSGGFERLLGPLTGTRSLARLAADPLEGELFVHELTTVPAGGAVEYLRVVETELAPLREEYGHELVGAFETLMSDTEVCTVWATTLTNHVALGAALDESRKVFVRDPDAWARDPAPFDKRLARWEERRRGFTTHWREELMIPCPGSPMGPDAWPGASQTAGSSEPGPASPTAPSPASQ